MLPGDPPRLAADPPQALRVVPAAGEALQHRPQCLRRSLALAASALASRLRAGLEFPKGFAQEVGMGRGERE